MKNFSNFLNEINRGPNPSAIEETDMKINSEELYKIFKKRDPKYLNDFFIGWMKIIRDLVSEADDEYLVHVTDWEIKKWDNWEIFANYDSYIIRDILISNHKGYVNIPSPKKSSIIKYNVSFEPITKGQRISIEDPLGEENWDDDID
jgi:hypothetical protein